MTKKKTTVATATETAPVTGNALFQEATLNQSSNNILSKEEANNILVEIAKLKEDNTLLTQEIQKLNIDKKQAELLLDQSNTELSNARSDHYATVQNIYHYTGSFWQRLIHLFQGYGSVLYSSYHSVD